VLQNQAIGPSTPIVVKGPSELDAATAPALHDELALLFTVGATEVVVDMGAVGFVDSTGLGALVGLRRQAKQRGIELRVTNVGARVRRTMEISGIIGFLGIDDPAH
jgi:anti-sigma B factor antagonist